MAPPKKPCGTLAAYRRGCRCELCREANRNKRDESTPSYKRGWRQRTNGRYLKANETYVIRFCRFMVGLRKAAPCKDCGNSFPSWCMDLDHLPDFKKEFKIATEVGVAKDWRAIVTEMNKCEVVCANCHRTRTVRRRRGW